MKNKNHNKKMMMKKTNWRNRIFAISPMFVVQFLPNLDLTLAIILVVSKVVDLLEQTSKFVSLMYNTSARVELKRVEARVFTADLHNSGQEHLRAYPLAKNIFGMRVMTHYCVCHLFR